MTYKCRLRWNNYKEHMELLVFEHLSSNYHNGFLEDCSITLIDKTDGVDPARRGEYWRRGLKTVTPYGFSMIEWFFLLGKFLNSCKILCIFREKGVYTVKYIVLTYFIISIICVIKLHISLFYDYYYYYIIITITIITASIFINIIVIVIGIV